MQSLLVYGAGGLGREIEWLAADCGYRVCAFVSDTPNSDTLTPSVARAEYPDTPMVIAVGDAALRRELARRARRLGFGFASLIHPAARVGPRSRIGAGVIICAGVTATVDVTVGDHAFINLHCTVGHDSSVGRCAALMPGVHISGYVVLGHDVYAGTGAVVLNGTRASPLHVGHGATIGAGAVVRTNVPPRETWVGVPARPMRGHEIFSTTSALRSRSVNALSAPPEF